MTKLYTALLNAAAAEASLATARALTKEPKLLEALEQIRAEYEAIHAEALEQTAADPADAALAAAAGVLRLGGETPAEPEAKADPKPEEPKAPEPRSPRDAAVVIVRRMAAAGLTAEVARVLALARAARLSEVPDFAIDSIHKALQEAEADALRAGLLADG